MWQTVPVALASFQEQFDLSGLLRFPVSFASFFVLYVIFGLVDVSTILGGLCCVGIWLGVTLARPDLFALDGAGAGGLCGLQHAAGAGDSGAGSTAGWRSGGRGRS